jgi:hypothetical protein
MTNRSLIFSVAAALAISTPIAAQSPTTSDARAGRTVKITGCVERASDVVGDKGGSGLVLAHSRGGRAGKQLTPRSGRVYQLDPSGDESALTAELGYRVSVTGQIASAQSSSSAATGTAGSGTTRATDRTNAGEQLPTLVVKSVERTPGACPAGW